MKLLLDLLERACSPEEVTQWGLQLEHCDDHTQVGWGHGQPHGSPSPTLD